MTSWSSETNVGRGTIFPEIAGKINLKSDQNLLSPVRGEGKQTYFFILTIRVDRIPLL